MKLTIACKNRSFSLTTDSSRVSLFQRQDSLSNSRANSKASVSRLEMVRLALVSVRLLFVSAQFPSVPPSSYRKLSDVAMQMDAENKQIPLVLVGLPEKEEPAKKVKKKKIRMLNFVAFADEYSSINEHVIINFLSFIAKLSIVHFINCLMKESMKIKIIKLM